MRVNLKRGCLAAALASFLLLSSIGCRIEEADQPLSGSVFVTLSDTSGVPIPGALIVLDGRVTSRQAPTTLVGILPGIHTIGVEKPGIQDTSIAVTVIENQTVTADLRSFTIEHGAIKLVGAPYGTVLLVNGVRAGTVPTAIDTNVFIGLGYRTVDVSAFLPGFATELPSLWRVTLSSDEPLPLVPLFTEIPVGNNVGMLAPEFDLPDDWDSTLISLQNYRGKVILVNFFFYNCIACIEELPYIQTAYTDPEFEGKFEIIGVNFIDSYAVFKNFRVDHPALGLTFPLVHDRSQQVRNAYGVTLCPANFLVDQTGRIRLKRNVISETELRQTLAELLSAGNAPTFSFEMHDTLIAYTDGDLTYEFYGVVKNLLPAPRSVLFTLTPVSNPDTARQFSICTWRGCYPPKSGASMVTENYEPMQADTAVRFSIYNYSTDWSGEFPVPMDSLLWGDYELLVSAQPADNQSERTEFRLKLDDLNMLRRNPETAGNHR